MQTMQTIQTTSRFRPIHRGDKPAPSPDPATGGTLAPATCHPQPSTLPLTARSRQQADNPQPPAKGLKKISFAKPAKKEETKTNYPVFADPEHPEQAARVVEIAGRIKTRGDQIEALEGAQATDKAELRMFVAPFYFEVNRGKPEPPSSISIPSDAGEVLVTFQNRYTKLTDESALGPLLGADLDKWFRQAFKLTVNGELLPPDKAQDIVNEIQAVLARHNCMDALDVKEEIKPVKDFHVARHSAFMPSQNLCIDEVCPMIVMIKTKGRGSK
jgi:hypothetical protein